MTHNVSVSHPYSVCSYVMRRMWSWATSGSAFAVGEQRFVCSTPVMEVRNGLPQSSFVCVEQSFAEISDGIPDGRPAYDNHG